MMLELAVPVLAPEAWCHDACYRRWATLARGVQGLLGGHIHFDADGQCWSVPFQVPLRKVGELSAGGVAR